MKIIRRASKVAPVMKRISIVVISIFGFVGLGLSPAQAVDERVIDIVTVSWAGSTTPPATVDQLAVLVNTEVNKSWKSFTTLVGDSKDRSISLLPVKLLQHRLCLILGWHVRALRRWIL